jgi:chromosome segregation ATPase
MAKHLTASLLMFSLIGTSAISATSVHAGMYRYTDENGQVVIGSSVPQEATQRGYDILNNNGRVVTIIAPAPTEQELAERSAEQQRQDALDVQREQDRKLLKRFSHPDQARSAMNRKVRELEGLIRLKKGNITVISGQLNAEQSRAADLERSGRQIPEATLEKMRRLETQILDIEQEIKTQTQDIQTLQDIYEIDIRRLQQLTDKKKED